MESDKATCKYKKLMRRWRPDWVVKARTHHSLLGNAKWTGKPTFVSLYGSAVCRLVLLIVLILNTI